MSDNTSTLLTIHRDMVRARKLDETLIDMYANNELAAMWHSGWGEEAVCALYSQLRRDDYCGYTHRGTQVWVSKGIPFNEILAEFAGKAAGSASGKGGTHIVDIARGVLGRSAMQGGHFSLFTGAAIAAQIRQSDQVSIVSFGDGAATIGGLHEALNFAAIWKLPVVFLCANNTCSETERLEMIWAQPDIAKMAIPYDIPFEIVGDNDAFALAGASHRAIERARSGEGPTFIELKTFRMRAHMEKDPWDFPDRSMDEIEEWRGKDAIAMFEERLITDGAITQAEIEIVVERADQEVEAARAFALAAPPPQPEEAFKDIYGSLAYEVAR